jgi:hypothetical protein
MSFAVKEIYNDSLIRHSNVSPFKALRSFNLDNLERRVSARVSRLLANCTKLGAIEAEGRDGAYSYLITVTYTSSSYLVMQESALCSHLLGGCSGAYALMSVKE